MQNSAPSNPEAHRELCGLAAGRVGSLAPELLANHVIAVTAGGDWSVQRAAMEAVVRRWAFAKRDELRIASRPVGRARLGVYHTKRRGSRARPYTTQLSSLDPLHASCDCPDFVRGSLGVCKHVLVVLDDLNRRAGGLQHTPGDHRVAGDFPVPRLTWLPIRPLVGKGDWMERVQWIDGSPAASAGGAAWQRVGRWFSPAIDGRRSLTSAFAGDAKQRLALVESLIAVTQQSRREGTVPVCDPALGVLLEIERRDLTRVLGAAVSEENVRRHLRTMKQKLYPYQIDAVLRFLQTGRLLLADDMGLGKTIEALAIIHVLWRTRKVKRGLVVVPASLKQQWWREWQQFTDAPVTVVDGTPTQRTATYRGCNSGFLITNYEQVLRDLVLMQRFAPDLVVLDEAQRIKNWETKTAAYVKQIDATYRLVLTGTPMENRLDELASILEWVDPLALEPVWRLAPWHSTFVDGTHDLGGARNLDTLRSRLSHCMLRRVRRDVLSQLPPRTDTRVPIELTPAQRDEHNGLNQPIASLLRRAKNRPLAREEFLRLMQLLTAQRMICNGLALQQFNDVWPGLADVTRPTDALIASLSSPKLRELRELIAALVVEQRQKVVVFSQWRRMLRLAHWSAHDLLAQVGMRAAFFTGEESQSRRTQNIIEFHDDPRVGVLFCTDAGGVGLNLQRAASACVNVELPWNPAVLEQRIGRIYRLGQKKPVEVYNLVCDEGIESRIFDLVGNKKALFTGLFDGTSDEVAFERSGNFLNRMRALVDTSLTLPSVPEAEDADLHVESETQSDGEPLFEVAQPTLAARIAPAPELVTSDSTAPNAQAVAELFGRLRIERRADGGISIQAPKEAAQALGALFSGMAQLLADAGRHDGTPEARA